MPRMVFDLRITSTDLQRQIYFDRFTFIFDAKENEAKTACEFLPLQETK